MKSGSALKIGIDDVIRKLFEGGLFVKWNRDNRRHRKHEILTVPPLQMTFEHISLNFYGVLTASALLSTVTFVLELVVGHKMNQRSQSRFFIYLDRYLCAQRYFFRSDT